VSQSPAGEAQRSMDVDALYQEIILDHYKNPHHEGLREPFEAEVHHVNPTCGDEVTVRVHLSGAGEAALVDALEYTRSYFRLEG